MSEYFTRADAFAPTKLAEEEVSVPGLGKCRVRELTCAALDKLQVRQSEDKTKGLDPERRWRAGVIVATAVGEDGSFLFRDADIEDLAESSAKRWEGVYRAAMRLSGMAGSAEAEAGKNSESGQPA